MKIKNLPHNVPIRIDPNLIKFKKPFVDMFLYKKERMLEIAANIKKYGYDPAFLIKVIEINGELYCTEGHHRTLAGRHVNEKVIVIIIDYESEYHAYLDARQKQGLARKLTNDEIFQHVVSSLEVTNYVKNAKVSPLGENRNRETIKNEIAIYLSIGAKTIERCYKIIDNGTEEQKGLVLSGKKSINQVYNEITAAEKPKKEKTKIICEWQKESLVVGGERILDLNPAYRYANQKKYMKLLKTLPEFISEVLK